jgi:hypothetical protein
VKDSETVDIALLVHSCDRYEFLYKGFDIFFSKYWDFDIPCNYYFATEEKVCSINGFNNIHSGKGEWSDRLSLLLNEMIREKYILYFQEDMWLSKKINKNFFVNLFELVLKNNWKQVKLHSSEVYKTTSTGSYIEGFNIAKVDNASSDFLMSHQVTLWDKDFLLRQLLKKEHPWRNERLGTKRLKKLNPEIYHVDYFSENGKPEINKNVNPIGRSEYITVSENGTLKDDVQQFISELLTGSDEEKKYAAELEYHYINKLTHDGDLKPRKEDILKKIKKLLQKR